MKLRSVELRHPVPEAAAAFLREVWLLNAVAGRDSTAYLAGSGGDPYLLALSRAPTPAIASITFTADEQEIGSIRARARTAGVPVEDLAATDEPGAGPGILLVGPEYQTYRFLHVTAPVQADDMAGNSDRPVRLTHVVLNTADLAACEAFATDVLGFRISDRTRIMSFARCNRKHHCVAYAPASSPSLNHIAFEMRNTDAVMRGIGRLRDAGIACAWGPGRHGPGNNVFAYFIAPYGGIIEYTSEVSEVDDNYRVGSPADWTWPPGRIDQWGVSAKDLAGIGAAERFFRFAAPGA